LIVAIARWANLSATSLQRGARSDHSMNESVGVTFRGSDRSGQHGIAECAATDPQQQPDLGHPGDGRFANGAELRDHAEREPAARLQHQCNGAEQDF